VVEREVQIPAEDRGGRPLRLPGSLCLPGDRGLVVFAHGSGSSRLSPRNRSVADVLNDAGLATLLFDLLSPSEADDRANVFDAALLATRVLAATRWARGEPDLAALRIGYFGASTGAAGALVAAVEGGSAGAVVSRGGRPDLVDPDLLARVAAPTLLIVGARDTAVLALNRQVAGVLRCEHDLVVIPGATHLFEEPGALEQVALLARDWFLRHLGRPGGPAPAANAT
jgi:putative phosphoribosyl transferase